MQPPPETAVPLSVAIGGCLMLLAGLTVLAIAASRLNRGLPVLPYARRRPVPWGAFHVGVIAAAFVVLIALSQWVAVRWFELFIPSPDVPASQDAAPPHHLVILLKESHTLPTFLLCFLSAVIVAPIVEEFLFRLVLQGWLEAVERRLRRRIAFLRQWVPGAVPVVLVATLFAGIHYRAPSLPVDVRTIVGLIIANLAAYVAVLTFGFGLLRWDAGARADDLGIVRGKWLDDLRLGVLTFVAFAAVIYLLKLSLSVPFGENVADPLALFPFALALGVLYYRTHRLTPCIVLHMSLNFTSLIMAWFVGL